MFAKLAGLILFSYTDPIYGVVFAAVALLHLLILPEPVYQGPENVLYFRGEELEAELARDKRVVWIIELYAAWNPTSVDFASCFAELSARSVLFLSISACSQPNMPQIFAGKPAFWESGLIAQSGSGTEV